MPPSETLYRVILLLAIFVIAIVFESFRPLRTVTQPKIKRVWTNLLVALTGAIILRAMFFPIVALVSQETERNKWGLLHLFDLNSVAALGLAIVLLDYTFYFWHVLLHKNRFLWRFHNVHHVDLDLDTSTALRFHFGELIISVVFRSAQIVVIGVNPFALFVFEVCITSFAQFHHSNIRLPMRFEHWLTKVIVGPRMHGVHHSIVRNETDSNFGTIFTLWDRLHNTLRLHIPQEDITIGVPSYRQPGEQGLLRLLSLPFERQRQWKLPSGKIPERSGTRL